MNSDEKLDKITAETLKKCLPNAKDSNIGLYLKPLQATLEKYEINTPKRIAAFLAQLAHESGSFRYVVELASGEAYENRKSLGNVFPGDGVKFKGRGLIQITGRSNYKAVSDALGYDFIRYPEDLAKPDPAMMSAGWFWKSRGLNELADVDDFEKITKRINGGLTHYDDRLKHWEICKSVLIK